jgi:multidrug resistance efflux pump
VDIQNYIRSRAVRIALAAMLIVAGAWAFVPYLFHRVSASAFVNAELIRVTAPISGKLSEHMPRPGDIAPEAKAVPLVQATSPDNRHLFDLQKQYAIAKENAALVARQLEEVEKLDAEFARRTDAFQQAVVERLSLEIAEGESEKKGCRAEVKQRQDVGTRMDALAKAGLASEIRSAESNATKEAAFTRCEVADARVARLRAEWESAKRGVFVRDGTNDVPYSQQQRDRMFLRRQELELQQLQEASRTAQLTKEIETEKVRLQKIAGFDLTLPETHVVWSTAASPGSAVTEGQTILDLADCAHKFVAVELPERDFEKVKVGSIAAVRLVGSNEWLTGRVQNIRGSAANSDHRLFAAQVRAPTPGTITVEVALPANQQRADGSFCGIGRLAEVHFPRADFGMPSALVQFFDWITGGSQVAAVSQAKGAE